MSRKAFCEGRATLMKCPIAIAMPVLLTVAITVLRLRERR